jgi:hypothetical protein
MSLRKKRFVWEIYHFGINRLISIMFEKSNILSNHKIRSLSNQIPNLLSTQTISKNQSFINKIIGNNSK